MFCKKPADRGRRDYPKVLLNRFGHGIGLSTGDGVQADTREGGRSFPLSIPAVFLPGLGGGSPLRPPPWGYDLP